MAASKAQREFRRKRIIEALKKDPSVTNQALKERFGIAKSTNLLASCREEAGVPQPDDYVSKDRDKCKTPERFATSPWGL